MVEAIGAKATINERSATRIAASTPATATAETAPVAAAAPVAAVAPAAPETQLSGIAAQLSTTAPVDLERVATIKRAIANGSFPILPSTIADRLLALRMDWNPNGETRNGQSK